MNAKLLLVCSVALGLCSCRRSNTPDQQAGADTGGTIALRETTADAELGPSWELVDKSALKATTAPWPPAVGAVILKAEVTRNAESGKFGGSVACRVSISKRSSAVWQPMQKVGEGTNGSVYFEAPLFLVRGPAYVQFRVRGAGERALGRDFMDLTNWKVEVR